MDGWAKILMQDNIIKGVQEWQGGQDNAVENTALKKKAKEQYSMAMIVWKVWEMDWKEQNAKLKSKWEGEVREWGVERDSAKSDCHKLRWMKPKMLSMEKAFWKPLLADFAMQGSESNVNDEDDGDADPLMSDDSDLWCDQELSQLGTSCVWCDWSIDLVSADNKISHWSLHCTVQYHPIIVLRHIITNLVLWL